MIREAKCCKCVHYWINPNALDQGTCRFNPPQLFMVGIHPNQGPMFMTNYPAVAKEECCSKFDDAEIDPTNYQKEA